MDTITKEQVQEWLQDKSSQHITTKDTICHKELCEWLKTCEVEISDLSHVAKCCMSIAAEVFNLHECGEFGQAVILNNFKDVIFKADDINLKYLKVYAYFMHWMLPMEDIQETRKRLKISKGG